MISINMTKIAIVQNIAPFSAFKKKNQYTVHLVVEPNIMPTFNTQAQKQQQQQQHEPKSNSNCLDWSPFHYFGVHSDCGLMIMILISQMVHAGTWLMSKRTNQSLQSLLLPLV